MMYICLAYSNSGKTSSPAGGILSPYQNEASRAAGISNIAGGTVDIDGGE